VQLRSQVLIVAADSGLPADQACLRLTVGDRQACITLTVGDCHACITLTVGDCHACITLTVGDSLVGRADAVRIWRDHRRERQ
jgi:hypothetical protein